MLGTVLIQYSRRRTLDGCGMHMQIDSLACCEQKFAVSWIGAGFSHVVGSEAEVAHGLIRADLDAVSMKVW